MLLIKNLRMASVPGGKIDDEPGTRSGYAVMGTPFFCKCCIYGTWAFLYALGLEAETPCLKWGAKNDALKRVATLVRRSVLGSVGRPPVFVSVADKRLMDRSRLFSEEAEWRRDGLRFR